MKKLSLLLFFVLFVLLGIQAQNTTLPYTQNFAVLTDGGMDDAGNSGTAVSVALDGIASSNNVYQAGGVLKLGSSTDVGEIYLTPIDVGAATSITLSFKAVPFTGTSPQQAKIIINYGSQADTLELVAATHDWPLNESDMLYYSVYFNAESTPTEISMVTVGESSFEKMVFIDDLSIIETVNNLGGLLAQDFEGTEFPPIDWVSVNISGSDKEWKRVENSDFWGSSVVMGTASASVGYTNNTNNYMENMLITPLLAPQSGEELSFFIRAASVSAGTTFQVQVSTDTDDPSDFTTTLLTLTTNSPNTIHFNWEEKTVDLSAYVGQDIYIGFRSINEGGQTTGGSTILIDNINGPSLSVPGCPKVSGLTYSNVSMNSADVSWTETGTATNWTLQYSTVSDFSDNVVTINATTTSVTLSSLYSGTEYFVRVKAICDPGVDESKWIKTSFRTLCGSVSIGWMDNFNEGNSNDGDKPFCWNILYDFDPGTGTTFPKVSRSQGHSSVGALQISGGTDENVTLIATPEFSDQFVNAQLVFWTKRAMPATFIGTVEVGVMSDLNDSSTFTPLSVIQTEHDEWIEHSVPLVGLDASYRYVAFRVATSQSTNIYVDEVYVREMPTCVKPNNLTLLNQTASTIEAIWEAGSSGESQWTIQYKESSQDTWNEISNITTNRYTITGLTEVTSYDVRVKAVCGAGDESEYTFKETISTTCPLITTLSEDFNDISTGYLPECWKKIDLGSGYGKVEVVSPSSGEGVDTKAIKLYNSKPLYLVSPPLGIPLSTLQLKFKLNKEGLQSGIIQVGYMSDPNDASTFVAIEDCNNEGIYKTFVQKTINLNHVPDTVDGIINRYIAFRYGDVGSIVQRTNWFYWIDDVIVRELPTCIEPSELGVTATSTNSIDISWIAGNTETEWVVEYKSLYDNDWNVVTPNVTTTSYSISGLTAATGYKIRVRAICSANDSSAYTEIGDIIYTDCNDDISSLNETFDNFETSNMPLCWSYISPNSRYPKIDGPDSGNGLPSKAVKFINARPLFLVTPKFSSSFGGMQLKFKLNREDANSGIIQVGYMSNPSDASTFVVLENYQPTEFQVFVDYLLDLSSIPDSTNGVANRYLAFRYGNVGSVSQSKYRAYWLDDVSIEDIPQCLEVTGLQVDTVTSSSATLSFTATNSETEWQYAITDVDSINTPEGLTIVDVTTNHITIDQLEDNTNYKVWVRAKCSESNFSDYSRIDFTTRCNAMTVGNTLWLEDFETFENTSIPTCWTQTIPYTIGSSPVAFPRVDHSYGSALRFGGKGAQIISTPEFVEDVNAFEIEFDLMRSNQVNSGTFEVGVLSNPNDPNTFVVIQDVTPMVLTDGTFQRFIISLASAPADNHYIAFRQVATKRASYYLDNINIHLIPTCFKPTNIRVDSVTDTSANILWTAGANETAWVLEYKVDSDSVWTQVNNVNDTSYSLSGLSPQTSYNVRLKSVCTPGSDESFWTQPVTFRTGCSTFDLPFTEDFSGGAVPPSECWGMYSGRASEVFAGQLALGDESYDDYYRIWKYGGSNEYAIHGEKAMINIHGTRSRYWLVTPSLNVTSDYALVEFDYALTQWNSPNSPDTITPDDKFMVVVSTDDGQTWLRQNATVWAEDGTGDYLLREIDSVSSHMSLYLPYTGIIKVAFYVESTVTGSDTQLHLDNINISNLDLVQPTVITQDADNITDTGATLHKLVTQGTFPITSEGFRYKPVNGTLWISSTDGNITGLTQGTDYEFFAYAMVDDVLHSGDTLQFTTTGQISIPPVVTTQSATDVQYTSATLNKTVVADPSEPIVSEGWKYKSVNDNIWSTTTEANVTDLLANTEYEFYAFATTAVNVTGYNGDTLTFTTLAHIMPTVTTEEATDITYNAATLNKTVVAGSEDITAEGFKYRVVGSNIWADVADGNLTGLQANTEYEFKAYVSTATYPNVEGEVLTFTTLEQSVGVDLVEYSVNIYPNPAKEVVTIQVEGLDADAEVTILDLQGKVLSVYNIDTASNLLSVNVSELSDATYIVRIKSENINITKRLIIKK